MKFNLKADTSFKLQAARWVIWGNLFCRWYDLWIGIYYDRANRYFYVCPLPCFGIKFTFRRKLSDEQLWSVIAAQFEESQRLESLSVQDLVGETLKCDEIADHTHTIALLDRVLPGWENLDLSKKERAGPE